MGKALGSLQEPLGDRQHGRIMRVSFPNGDGPSAQLLVNKLDAVEVLSRPFEYMLDLLSDDPNVALKDLQGKAMCVELVRKDGSMRYFTGLVFSFGLKTVDGGVSYYEAKLGPWYKYLSMRKDNNLFHNTMLYQQTSSIFGDYGSLADWDGLVQGASDGERVVLTAENEIELRCGEAALRLSADGRIQLRGTYIPTHASPTRRILGASVNIN